MRSVIRSKWLRILVLAMIAAMVLALPLAGCKKAPASQTGGGQDTGGQGTGGSSGAAQGVAFFKFEPGQHLKYQVSMPGGQGGWFSLDISDGGGGKLKIDFAGAFAGQAFSGTVNAGADTVAADLAAGAGTNPFAAVCLVPVVAIPWNQYFSDGQWGLGSKWAYEAGGATWSFEVTGNETYAGITGSAGTWKATAGGQTTTCTFCVNPDFPMALHTKFYTAADAWLEYTLEEATGF